ncbi:CDP-glucose 4,6-dehydratase [Synechococcus sp. EJ6-Ellesmere]|uniref:CDP-glucose 4,6-dehydratase n=1 Tax=Synechococcus sp. EJ6-Ellesmere TaxID=2823734 RepID=UPI0020CD96F1|nr:CDP-glucose 4,6-dehydratase [Synechococcus sp. EJ6-Ellesmere]MCP9825458.1 CDP-glucose 4,6-dehydratase [Synechococcus sp. EJ6-Ellesmere]
MLDPAFWRGRRVLLTGHTGFKGAWLLLWLQELGAQVWCYSLEAEPAPNLFRQLAAERPTQSHAWHHQVGNLADLAELNALVELCQPEVVLHLAAQPLVRRSYRDPLGTWATNVQGSLHLLEALKPLEHPCAVVMVTTDKVYENREWPHGYRECDRLGGHDPYSASKAAAELAIASWRASFCGTATHQTPHLRIATARAGNVIGGGDWAEDRIVPDAMRALAAGQTIAVRRPKATRPWQHVLEPLGGYLLLAELLAKAGHAHASAFNFGPNPEANRSVQELLEEALRHWPGSWSDQSAPQAPHEAGLLQLEISKARQQLGWQPRWDFATTVVRTVDWYRAVQEGASPMECCLADLEAYTHSMKAMEFSQT